MTTQYVCGPWGYSGYFKEVQNEQSDTTPEAQEIEHEGCEDTTHHAEVRKQPVAPAL